MIESPLTLAELRELERDMESTVLLPGWFERSLRAVRELIALQEQQGMPWRQLHKNGLVKLLKLEGEMNSVLASLMERDTELERLRKAAAELLRVNPEKEGLPMWKALRSAIAECRTPQAGVQ